MTGERKEVIVSGLDLIDVIELTDKKLKKYIAITLQDLEELFEEQGYTPDHFKFFRKIILDGFNNYTRSLMRILLGDIEMGAPHSYDK
jgi:hypothetical protein